MKKVLGILLAVLATLSLVGCNASAKVPSVNEKHKVSLTQEEFQEEIKDVNFKSGEAINTKGTMQMEMTVLSETALTAVSYDIYAKSKEVNASIESTIKADGRKLVSNLNMYVKDETLYLDGKGLESLLGDGFEEGKYKIPANITSDVFGELITNTEVTDFGAVLQDSKFLDLIASYEGLSFYKNENDFRIKLIINKELIIQEGENIISILTALSGESYGTLEADELLETLDTIDTFNYEVVIVIKDNVLIEAGYRVQVKMETNILGSNLATNLDMTMLTKVGVEMPAFPNFSNYQDLINY